MDIEIKKKSGRPHNTKDPVVRLTREIKEIKRQMRKKERELIRELRK